MTNEQIKAMPVMARFIRRKYLDGTYSDDTLQLFVDVRYITAEQMEMFQEDKANMENENK